jgi:hypothetical protein
LRDAIISENIIIRRINYLWLPIKKPGETYDSEK